MIEYDGAHRFNERHPYLLGHFVQRNHSDEPSARLDVLWVRRWLCREPELARVLPHCSQVYLRVYEASLPFFFKRSTVSVRSTNSIDKTET